MHMAVVSPARAATVVTHAWTKLHTQNHELSLHAVYMSAVYAWTLPEATSTIVHNLHHCEQPAVEGL